jgi:hypothetical protein
VLSLRSTANAGTARAAADVAATTAGRRRRT